MVVDLGKNAERQRHNGEGNQVAWE
jgi:hypothetical protein